MVFRKILYLILSIIYVALTGILTYLVLFTTELSSIYKYLICVGLLIISVLILVIYYKHNTRKIKKRMTNGEKLKIKFFRVTSHFVMILLCACLAFGDYTLFNVKDFLDDITVSDEENVENTVNVYYVYTYKDSGITSLANDFSSIGVIYSERGALYSPFSDYMEEQYSKVLDTNYSYQNYLTLEECVSGLYGKAVPLIICSDDMYNDILAYDSSFDSKATRIATIELTNGVNSKPVDVSKECFNVLILGVDIRANEGTIKTDSRCDSIMIASFNPKTMAISLVSIPRDAQVQVNGLKDKITHSGNYGIPTVIDTVENLLGIEINYYAKFNFTALVDLIDAIGGVDVDVLYPFTEQDSNDVPDAITLEAGFQHLNGEQALAYARHRKTVTDGARANAQQQIIQAMANKMVSLSSITKFKSILSVLSSNMMTNFTTKELYALMQQCPKLGDATFASLVLSGTDDETYLEQYGAIMYTMKLDESSVEAAKQQIADNAAGKIPTVQESTDSTETTETTSD